MRKLKHLLTIIAMLCASIASAQYFDNENGFIIKDYKLDDFSKIDVINPVKVVYKALPDSAGHVIISGNKDFIKDVSVKSEKGVFYIKNVKKTIGNDTITINLYSSSLDNLNAKGGAYVHIDSSVDAPEISFKIDGESVVIANEVNCGVLKVSSKDNANLYINGGKVGVGDYNTSGKGTLQVFKMISESAIVTISGSGTVRCHATRDLNVTITGSGKLYYTGTPTMKAKIPTRSQIAVF